MGERMRPADTSGKPLQFAHATGAAGIGSRQSAGRFRLPELRRDGVRQPLSTALRHVPDDRRRDGVDAIALQIEQ